MFAYFKKWIKESVSNFDCRGCIMSSCHRVVQSIRNIICKLCAMRAKRPDLWKNKNWLLHHDNAPAHTSLLVREYLVKNNTLMMPQPPYSPDLAPCDFFLFPKLKRPLKGRRYATIDDDFFKCFEDWEKRWHKCIISEGNYFEGDKIDINE